MSNKTGIRKGKDFTKNMEKLKKIYGGKIPKNLTFKEADADLKKVTPFKKKAGGSTDFGMLSVKHGVDNNPNETRADYIAGATKGKSKKPQGAFFGKIFQDPKIRNMMFARIKGDQAIQDPEAYKKAYNKYATAYGNEPMKDDPKVATADQGKFIVRGMGAAIRGGKTKGSS